MPIVHVRAAVGNPRRYNVESPFHCVANTNWWGDVIHAPAATDRPSRDVEQSCQFLRRNQQWARVLLTIKGFSPFPILVHGILLSRLLLAQSSLVGLAEGAAEREYLWPMYSATPAHSGQALNSP